jgi:serine/threonine protein kinase
MTEPLDPLAAALSDRYRLERELGRGGMATVYEARDLRHDRRHNLLDEEVTTDMLSWEGTGGFFAASMLRAFDGSVDASVHVEGSDRHGIERLVRPRFARDPSFDRFPPGPFDE